MSELGFGGMRPFGAVLPFEHARQVMLDAAGIVEGHESVPFASASSRVGTSS